MLCWLAKASRLERTRENMNHISKALRGVADKYNGVSLIIRIIVGLIAGTALALVVPHLTSIGEFGTLFVSAVKAVAPILVFVLVALAVAVGFVLIAYLVEKYLKKKNQDRERILSTRKIAMIGVFSAIAMVLHIFDFAVPVLAPPFYKLDFSEIPALIGAFAFGPVAGVMIEFIKIMLKLLIKGTSTAFVGDFANFVIGCSFILPASIIYLYKKSRKSALIGSVTGTLIMTVFGTAFNAIYLLPTFAVLYHMPMEDIIAMGTAINGHIDNVVSLVIFCVAPINLIKGTAVTLVTMLVYKKLSPILKGKQHS